MLARHYAYRIIAILILLVFAAFFFGPIVWLLLAPTKTDSQIINQTPLAFGSFGTFGHTFHQLISYEGDLVLTWLKNSAIYSFGGTRARSTGCNSGRIRPGADSLRRAPRAARDHARRDDRAGDRARPAAVSRGQYRALGRHGLVAHLAVRVLPVGVYLAYIYFSRPFRRI